MKCPYEHIETHAGIQRKTFDKKSDQNQTQENEFVPVSSLE